MPRSATLEAPRPRRKQVAPAGFVAGRPKTKAKGGQARSAEVTRLAAAAVPERPTAPAPLVSSADDAWRYPIDLWQRSVLFLDALRERADNMLAHEAAGLPPVLHFESETVLDARTFAQPANYALLRIVATDEDRADECVDRDKPPVIVIDPRAGHGPGIGGFKRDSEVGIALHEGFPVYFVTFFPEPCPGQTLADVLHALRRFVEFVTERHGKPPVLYGNCQAGWAAALLSADCEGLAGPVVLNGSPLSYWAGEAGVNPLRVAGGLVGGAWLAHFLADLGDGRFDGAWLVQNFENLKPETAVWDKYAGLFADIDGERERFLDFERWWNGFHSLSREEFVAVVENLFIGNKLEEGKIRLCEGCYVDLRRIRNPLVIFASHGDNITPPHQALGWIPAVYESTADLKRAGQRIVYLLNPHVGHLGLFVSAKVARFEHHAILESLANIEALEPGLYEMTIANPTGDPDCHKPQYTVAFEPRRMEDIRFDYPRQPFERVRAVSEFNEYLYRTFASPWVRAFATPWTAAMMKWLHPMRSSRYAFAETINPAMLGIAALAATVRHNRQPVPADSPYRIAEKALARSVFEAIESCRKLRDRAGEETFRRLYS